jgi:hypothetical protein
VHNHVREDTLDNWGGTVVEKQLQAGNCDLKEAA